MSQPGCALLLIQLLLIFATQVVAGEPITRKSFEYGQDFFLKCTNNQSFKGEIMWRKDGKELESTKISYNITLINMNTTSIVSKLNLTQEDEGNYECVANGKVLMTYKVFVHSKVKIMSNELVRVSRGAKLKLTCIGTADLDLEWMIPYEDANRTNVVAASNKTETTISIYPFGYNDTGSYICIGRRLMGDQYEEASDTVNVVLIDSMGPNFPDQIWPWLALGVSAIALAGLLTGFVYYRNTKRARESHGGAAYLRSETSS